jgi:hypothetical protein
LRSLYRAIEFCSKHNARPHENEQRFGLYMSPSCWQHREARFAIALLQRDSPPRTGQKPPRSKQKPRDNGCNLKAEAAPHELRAREKLSVFKRSAAGDELSTAQCDFFLGLPFAGFSKTETTHVKWSHIDLVHDVTASPWPRQEFSSIWF